MSALPTPAAEARPRVLVAEDQHSIWDALQFLLAAEGYEAEFVGTPAEAVSRLHAVPFDLVLMDLNYTRDTTSGQEGLDLIAQVQALDSSLPIVVMTAWGSVGLAVEALQRGASDFVEKPWQNQHLARILRTQYTRGCNLRKHHRERDHEVSEAVRIQQRLLPKSFPTIPGYGISGASQPARLVGGDYFDVLLFSPLRVGLCIADVCGKGLPAALLMSNLQASLRATAQADTPPAQVCARVNRILCENVDSEKFASLFYCVLDAQTNTLTYCNAGHFTPLLVRPGVGLIDLPESGAVLGAFPAWNYEQGTVQLQRGDRLVFYTDGATEATNTLGEEFGDESLLRTVIEHLPAPAPELRARLLNRVSEFCTGCFDDDITLLVLAAE